VNPKSPSPDISKRAFLRGAVALGGMALVGRHALADETLTLPFENGTRQLMKYPQKRPLIVMTSRPVQLETPFTYFDNKVFTPNDEFFVRWHLSEIPTSIDPATFRLAVRGRVKQPLSLSLDELKKNFETVEIAAVCQCAGNSRGLFTPRVPGGQWANGAMGNALWKGVRLKEVLNKAGVEADAVQVRFDGLDGPAIPQTPDFIKALDMDVALGDDILLAYEMNGEPLPLLNGYPLRLVAPGWYATYWVKMLHDIEVINRVDQEFWMKTAYRIPADPCGCVEPGKAPAKTIPINRMTVRSFITHPAIDGKITAGKNERVRGIAFDSGYGIKRVLFSSDGGQNWKETTLGKDHGKYSFREWSTEFRVSNKGEHRLVSLAINGIGETQRDIPVWNPGGYLRNVPEYVSVRAA